MKSLTANANRKKNTNHAGGIGSTVLLNLYSQGLAGGAGVFGKGENKMVAFNFSPRFARLVETGQKRQTIRRTLRCAPGDALQLFEGQRTAECRKLVDPDPICTAVHSVRIAPTGVFIDREPLSPHLHKEFAQADGFLDLQAMQDWFYALYGKSEMVGFLVKW
jgi:hypothetical protein